MIEIKLTDLPEFDRQLKITILLEKDSEGIRESISTSTEPSLPSSPVDPITPPTTKRAGTKKKTTQGSSKETGDGINAESSVKNSLSELTIETPTTTTSSAPQRKRSGNMMSMEF